jgi:hypothetical protein
MKRGKTSHAAATPVNTIVSQQQNYFSTGDQMMRYLDIVLGKFLLFQRRKMQPNLPITVPNC